MSKFNKIMRFLNKNSVILSKINDFKLKREKERSMSEEVIGCIHESNCRFDLKFGLKVYKFNKDGFSFNISFEDNFVCEIRLFQTKYVYTIRITKNIYTDKEDLPVYSWFKNLTTKRRTNV